MDIKKTIACLLFGGFSKKVFFLEFMSKNKSGFNLDLTLRLPGGLTRRGDINLLLLADPGTTKFQVLKFVERVAHIAVTHQAKVVQ